MWKICGLGIFTEYLSLRLCMLATLLHICLKHMHPDHVHTHLCEAYVYLDIWPCSHTSMWSLCLLSMSNRSALDIVSTELCPLYAHLSWKCVQWRFFNPSLSNICILAIYLHSYPKDMCLLPISNTSVLKMSVMGISLHICVCWAFPTHPFQRRLDCVLA